MCVCVFFFISSFVCQNMRIYLPNVEHGNWDKGGDVKEAKDFRSITQKSQNEWPLRWFLLVCLFALRACLLACLVVLFDSFRFDGKKEKKIWVLIGDRLYWLAEICLVNISLFSFQPSLNVFGCVCWIYEYLMDSHPRESTLRFTIHIHI